MFWTAFTGDLGLDPIARVKRYTQTFVAGGYPPVPQNSTDKWQLFWYTYEDIPAPASGG
jgi:hypothetical protein